MSQISPPMRILLAGAVVFLAVWFTLLRPKSDSVEPVAATPTATAPAGNVNTGQPAVSGAGKLVEKAKQAATQAEGAAKASAGESPATAATPDAARTTTGSATATAPDPTAAALPAVPAAALAKLPEDVAGAIRDRKVLVLAVLSDDAKRWRPMSDDDRYVRNTLKKVNRYDGQVLVKQVPLGSLQTYGPIVDALNVNQTPSVVVVDRKLQANVIPGYVDRISINQAIADARQASISPLITDSYLRAANEVCANFNVATGRWSLPTIPGRKAWVASTKRYMSVLRTNTRAIERLAAPQRWRSFKSLWLRTIKREDKLLAGALKKVKANDFDAALALVTAYDSRDDRKLVRRFDEIGLTSCSVLRRS